MLSSPQVPDPSRPSERLFATTHWSVVVLAGDLGSPAAHSALAQLCHTYWYPLYCCVRRHGYAPEMAQDLTQGFFAKLLEKGQFSLADPQRGRFRTFLLSSLENYLRTRHRDATVQKRGGGQDFVSWDAREAEQRYELEPVDGASPAMLFERQWAGALLEAVLSRLRREFSVSGRLELFDELEPHLWGDDASTPHAQIGESLSMSEVAVRVTLHRLRQRFQDLLRDEIANTVESTAEVEEELTHLRRVLAG